MSTGCDSTATVRIRGELLFAKLNSDQLITHEIGTRKTAGPERRESFPGPRAGA